MDFVAHINDVGTVYPELRSYPIDPTSWPEQVVATVVGVGEQELGPLDTRGPRKYGPTTIWSIGWDHPQILGPDPCPSSVASFDCAMCAINIKTAPTQLLPDGGPNGTGGDSGGPLIINYTELDATPINGLVPPGKPFVVGFGSVGNGEDMSPASWDSVATHGGQVMVVPTGTFLRDRLWDWDDDHVPDEYDNCPLAPNTDQHNCNEAAEQAWGFELLGDACDPIPCAPAHLREAELQFSGAQDQQYVFVKWGRAVRDRFDVHPLGSHHRYSGAQNHQLLPVLPVAAVPTHYRFCQKWGQVDCVTDAIDNALLHDEPSQPDASKPWMKAHLEVVPNGPSTDMELLGHPSGKQERRWQYFADYQYWAEQGMIDLDDCDPVQGCCSGPHGCGTNLDGRFWIRSATTKGTATNPAQTPAGPLAAFSPPNTGCHELLSGGCSSTNPVNPDFKLDLELSNHHFALAPDAAYGAAWGKKPLQLEFWYFIYKMLPPEPIDPLGWDGLQEEAAYVVPVAGGSYGLLRKNGRALVVDDYLGTHLQSVLATPGLVWASAVEPWLTASRTSPDEGFRALIFAADGTDVVEGVLQQGLQAGTSVDFVRPSPIRPGSPSPREGFVAVFSRSEDRAFVVGGSDSLTAQPTGDIWFRPVEGPGDWRQIDLDSFLVGTVLAATWSYHDGRLWVLDQVSTGWGKIARLYRVEPYLGHVQMVAAWPRLGVFDRFWLVLDRNGQVLLVGSSKQLRKHAIISSRRRATTRRLPFVCPSGCGPSLSRLLRLPIRLATRSRSSAARAESSSSAGTTST